MAQHKLTAGPLLDQQGQLVEAGWGTQLVRTYDRSAIKAPWHRIKEWDYYCVQNERFALAMVVADNSYMGLLSLVWIDFETGTLHEDSVMPFLTRGRLEMPASSEAGDIVLEREGMSLSFTHQPGGRMLRFSYPKFMDGAGLSGEIFLAQPEMDTMVIATPFQNAPKAFYYNQKINCMAASGTACLGGETYTFEPSSSFGVLDWGRGVWTYENTWYWGSASGLHEGKPFGFNIGYGFGDVSAASENMVFFGGRAHKLDRLEFHIPQSGHCDEPWRFSSSDGRFEVQFDPLIDRYTHTDLKIIKVKTHQVFGTFSGTVILDDGTKLSIDGVRGFAEEVFNRW